MTIKFSVFIFSSILTGRECQLQFQHRILLIYLQFLSLFFSRSVDYVFFSVKNIVTAAALVISICGAEREILLQSVIKNSASASLSFYFTFSDENEDEYLSIHIYIFELLRTLYRKGIDSMYI